jgi:hypothetical protein
MDYEYPIEVEEIDDEVLHKNMRRIRALKEEYGMNHLR